MEYFSQKANSEESKLMKEQCDIFVVLILSFPSFVTRFSGYKSGRGGRQDLTANFRGWIGFEQVDGPGKDPDFVEPEVWTLSGPF